MVVDARGVTSGTKPQKNGSRAEQQLRIDSLKHADGKQNVLSGKVGEDKSHPSEDKVINCTALIGNDDNI